MEDEDREDGEEKILALLTEQRGQIVALQSLVISLLRAMPASTQANALTEWDSETEIARASFLRSDLPDAVEAFDDCVDYVNRQRVRRTR